MTDPIEIMARGIWTSECGCTPFEALHWADREGYSQMARDALRALTAAGYTIVPAGSIKLGEE